MFYVSWRIRRKLVRHDLNTKEVTKRPDFQQRYGSIFPAFKQGKDWISGFQLICIILRGVFIGACQVSEHLDQSLGTSAETLPLLRTFLWVN